MDIDSTVRNLRVMMRANTIIAGIHGRRLAARTGLNAFAGLIGAFGLLMLGVAVFFALERIWGPVWAAAAVGGFNVVLALVLVLIAGRMKPGGELDLATEVRDAAVDSVVGDLRAVEADLPVNDFSRRIGYQAHHGKCANALTATTLSHQTQGLTFFQIV